MVLSPLAIAMVLKSTKDLSLQTALRDGHHLYISSLYSIFMLRDYNAYVTLLSYAQMGYHFLL